MIAIKPGAFRQDALDVGYAFNRVEYVINTFPWLLPAAKTERIDVIDRIVPHIRVTISDGERVLAEDGATSASSSPLLLINPELAAESRNSEGGW